MWQMGKIFLHGTHLCAVQCFRFYPLSENLEMHFLPINSDAWRGSMYSVKKHGKRIRKFHFCLCSPKSKPPAVDVNIASTMFIVIRNVNWHTSLDFYKYSIQFLAFIGVQQIHILIFLLNIKTRCLTAGCSERQRNSYLPQHRCNQGKDPDIQFRY